MIELEKANDMLFTVLRHFDETLRRVPDKVALVQDDREITFAALHARARLAAAHFRAMGIARGDRIGICMNKSIDQVVAILGALYANAVFVPVLPKLKSANIVHIVADSGMRLMVSDEGRRGELAAVGDAVRIIEGATLASPIEAEAPAFVAIGPDDAAIIYSSGSTGRPKGIRVSHRNLHDGPIIVATYLGTAESDRILGILSFNFDYGLNQLWQTLMVGCTLVLHEMIFPNDTFRLIAAQRITVLPLMPVIITKLFDRRLFRANSLGDLGAVRTICSSGGRISQKMLDMIAGVFPGAAFYSMYGLTEAFRSSFLPPEELARRPTSIGKAIPGVELLVLDAEGAECAPGEIGELVHRGGCISNGYWNAPEVTARVFRERPGHPNEICVFSGDNVRRDEDGFLYFVGRRDTMIKTFGYRVSPTEIEEIVNTHPQIADSIAFGVVDDEIGERIVTLYTTLDGAPLEAKALSSWLESRLPHYMVPSAYIHRAAFPATGNEGKVDRASLKEAYLAEAEAAA